MKKEEKALTKNQIVEWKDQFGKIYKTTIGEQDFIWRPIRRKEYVELVKKNTKLMEEKGSDDLMAMQDEIYYQRQEDLVISCILSPEPEEMAKLVEEQGGLASALSDEIMEKSGFVQPNTQTL